MKYLKPANPNLVSSRCFGLQLPSFPDHWPSWLGLMRIVVKHLDVTRSRKTPFDTQETLRFQEHINMEITPRYIFHLDLKQSRSWAPGVSPVMKSPHNTVSLTIAKVVAFLRERGKMKRGKRRRTTAFISGSNAHLFPSLLLDFWGQRLKEINNQEDNNGNKDCFLWNNRL